VAFKPEDIYYLTFVGNPKLTLLERKWVQCQGESLAKHDMKPLKPGKGKVCYPQLRIHEDLTRCLPQSAMGSEASQEWQWLQAMGWQERKGLEPLEVSCFPGIVSHFLRPAFISFKVKTSHHGRTWVAVTSSLILAPTSVLLSQDRTRPLHGPSVPKKPNIDRSDPKGTWFWVKELKWWGQRG
jgi:hypothetical protein